MKETLKIGKICLKCPVIAAPMAGVTDKAFRILARKAGCCLAYSEMISDQALLYGNSRTLQMLDNDDEIGPEKGPLAVQIFGSEPKLMACAAAFVEAKGADLIDINMGCPTPKIVNNGEGAALMKKPGLAHDIVAAVVDKVSVPVTVKIRAGWDKHSINAVEIACLVAEAGAAAVAVHGRTREQFYAGYADWNIIKSVKQALMVPVIGNGDVKDGITARKMYEQTGCDGIMIGRAAMGNPWIFGQVDTYLKTGETVDAPSPVTKLKTCLKHFELLVSLKGQWRGVLEMRKHAAWYIKGLPGAAQIRNELNSAVSPEQLRLILVLYAESLAGIDMV